MIKKITFLGCILFAVLLNSQTVLNNFENSGAMGSDPAVESAYNMVHSITANPNTNGNTSTNVLRIGRNLPSANYWALSRFKLSSPYIIPANETRYLHVNVLYDLPSATMPITVTPDFRIRWNGTDANKDGSDGGMIAPNASVRYTNHGKWQDLVIPIEGGATGKTINWMIFHPDTRNPAQVLNSATDYCYIDNIEFSERSVPRNIYGETILLNDFEDSGAMSSDPAVVSAFGASNEVVANPNTKGNSSSNVLKLGRTSGNVNWYILSKFKMETIYSVPANESRYLHANVYYDRTATPTVPLTVVPDFRMRWDAIGNGNGSNSGILTPADNFKYRDEGEWQDIVIEIQGGADGKTISTMLFHPDTKGTSNGANNLQVLNSATDICYVDNIMLTDSASPRNLNSFTGTIDNNWNNAANWAIGVPTVNRNTEIPSGTNLEIDATTGAVVKNLTIDNGGSLKIKSGGSLIASGAVTGNLTYERTITKDLGLTNAWHSSAVPVSGATVSSLQAENSFADGSAGNRIGLATYNSSSSNFAYFTTSSTDALQAGMGLMAKIDNAAASNNLSFTGTYNASQVETDISQNGTNFFNFVGNPFTSYINLGQFFTDNNAANRLSEQTIWIWDENKNGANMGGYVQKMSGADAAFEIAPGQGFFVSAGNAASNKVTFNVANQSHKADSFLKEANTRTEVSLKIAQEGVVRSTDLYYIEDTTIGFDNGFDASLFTGVNSDLSIYSKLIADNTGKKLSVQSLPNNNFNNLIIPIDIKAIANKEITFSALTNALPKNINVILEDRENNIFTNLNVTNYKTSLDNESNGLDRFYLHTSSKTLSTDETTLTGVNIYKNNRNSLHISGLNEIKTLVKLYNIEGKQVLSKNFSKRNNVDVNLPNLATGIYILKLETEKGNLNKKIILE